MRLRWWMAGILAAAPGFVCAQAQQFQQTIPAAQLVRDVVYNELHDHQGHGYWRYWIERHTQKEIRPESRQVEQERLNQLLSSPKEQARHRQEYADDEKRIGRIVALLPEAFLYQYEEEDNGCYRLKFRPNPDYPAHSIEARIFHAMSGELWVDARFKRLARLDGHLEENVDFGYGILGRLYKGGWFQLERTQVSPTDWKTERLEVHMTGRALLFKTIAREASEVRGGFAAVPGDLSLAEGMALLEHAEATNLLAKPAAYGLRQ